MAKWQLGKGQFPAFKERMDNMIPDLMRIIMIEAYFKVMLKTPVDTGRARWGWYCSINNIPRGIPAEPPAAYRQAHDEAVRKGKSVQPYYAVPSNRALEAFITVKASDTLYIANSVPYIKRLNEGYSTQAPARFVESALLSVAQNMQNYLNRTGRG